jgi:hypothetical protein
MSFEWAGFGAGDYTSFKVVGPDYIPQRRHVDRQLFKALVPSFELYIFKLRKLQK